MDRIFQDFIEELETSKDEVAMSAALSRAVADCDLPRFAYVRFAADATDQGEVLPITNYPWEWRERYLAQRYDRIDPVLHTTFEKIIPFYWDGLGASAPLSKKQRKLFDEASDFGIRSGFTIPVHEGKPLAASLTFIAEGNIERFQKIIDSHWYRIHLISIYFHAYMRELHLRTISTAQRPYLTSRETQVLQWMARGKTTYEVGKIYGITGRTAVFHLENAKRKLGVVSVRQAVVEALMYGIITK